MLLGNTCWGLERTGASTQQWPAHRGLPAPASPPSTRLTLDLAHPSPGISSQFCPGHFASTGTSSSCVMWYSLSFLANYHSSKPKNVQVVFNQFVQGNDIMKASLSDLIRKRRGRSLLHYPFHINFFVHNINCQWKSNWRLRPSILSQNYGIKKDKHKHITQTWLTINCVHLGTHTGNWSIIIIIIILVVSCQ